MMHPSRRATVEDDRLLALRAYEVLDTPAEPALDELTELAAAICATPISLIALVDESRQWFKSRVGLELTQTPRSFSLSTRCHTPHASAGAARASTRSATIDASRRGTMPPA